MCVDVNYIEVAREIADGTARRGRAAYITARSL